MILITREFIDSDIELMKPRKEDKKLHADIPNLGELLIDSKSHSKLYSIMAGKDLVTIIALTKLFNGVGQTWQLPNKGMIQKYLKQSARHLIALEEKFFNEGYWRIFTYCSCDDKHNKWMKFLGYTNEGLLRKHAYDKSDVFIWAKVR